MLFTVCFVFMKIWLKYIIGSILGIVSALIISTGNATVLYVVEVLSELAIRIVRYSLLPLLFFSFTIAVFELRDSANLLKTGLFTGSVVVITTVLLAVIGLISVLIKSPQPIPIFVEETTASLSLNIADRFMQIFPYSGFEVFTNGAFLLPLCVFAGFAGAGCASDKLASKPALNLFDSLSRVSYSVMSFFIDIFSIALIAVSASWMFQFISLLQTAIFRELIIVLSIDLLFVALILYPLLLRITLGKINPYRILYASLASLMTAFFSGDTNATLPVSLRHANESLGIRRRVSSVAMPVFSIFGRGGASLTVIVSFVIILNSYSSLGISFKDMLWIVGTAVSLSFFLGGLPVGAPYIALGILCTLYGRTFEAGYLILKPAAFFICSVATAIDALTSMFGTYFIASKKGMVSHRELRFFI